MKINIDVSILIVNYNTCGLTLQCLQSVFSKTENISFEVIVVDNASTDDSVRKISNEFPQVKLIEAKYNLGFGKANNMGAKQASGNYLFLLNSDTILLENSTKILKDYLEKAPDLNIAVVGCKLLDLENQPHSSFGNFPSIWQEIFEYGPSKIFHKFYKERLSVSVVDSSNVIKEVDYIVGADMFFKKSKFDEVGGFDEDFFFYYEETELCFRLKKLGYKVIWNPVTSIIHHSGASSKTLESVNYWVLGQLQKSKYLYYNKCHGPIITLMVKCISIPRNLIRYRKFEMRKILKILFNPT